MFLAPLTVAPYQQDILLDYIKAFCENFGILCLGLSSLLILIAVLFFRKYSDSFFDQDEDSATNSEQSPKISPFTTHGVSHLAIVLDGNRRYAKDHKKKNANEDKVISLCNTILNEFPKSPTIGLSSSTNEKLLCLKKILFETSLDGHRIGAENVLKLILYSVEAKISVLTLYAFSMENWKREPAELSVLMTLLTSAISRVAEVAKKHGIFVRFISTDMTPLPPILQELMKETEEYTRKIKPRNLIVNICVSYSGQQEICNACTSIVLSRHLTQTVYPVSKEEIRQYMLHSITQSSHELEDKNLFTKHSIEPQLMIRTGGDSRISNFLLFECAYTELFFSPRRLPEFSRYDFFNALGEYALREKRYGK